MSDLQCSVLIPEIPSSGNDSFSNQLTVGRKFSLKCKGEWEKQFDFTLSQLQIEGLKPEMLKIFSAQATTLNEFVVELTLYVPVNVAENVLKLKDGVHEISLSHNAFNVESVLEKPSSNQPQQPPQSYGYSLGQIPWPESYFYLSGGLVIFCVLMFSYFLYRRSYWKRLEFGLKNFDSAMQPDAQAYRQLRTIEKSIIPEADFKNVIFLYILRRYQAPVYNLSRRQLSSYLKNKWPRLIGLRRQIFNFQYDLELFLKKSASMTNDAKVKEINKMIKRFYVFIDETEDAMNKSQRST